MENHLMKMKHVKKLMSCDVVTWTDPDNGKCSRTMVISSIKIKGNVVCIEDRNGGYLECLAEELSE